MSKVNLKEIELFFESYVFNDREVILDQCQTIKDVKLFTTTHISYLKGNSKKEFKYLYYDRLLKLYLKLKL